MLHEILGWAGSIMFAICALPQALMSVRQGHSEGLAWSFLALWLGGEVATLLYVLDKGDLLPLLVNYGLNLVFLSVILWYRVFPRRARTP